MRQGRDNKACAGRPAARQKLWRTLPGGARHETAGGSGRLPPQESTVQLCSTAGQKYNTVQLAVQCSGSPAATGRQRGASGAMALTLESSDHSWNLKYGGACQEL